MVKAKAKYWHAVVFDVYEFLLKDELSKSEVAILFYLLKEMRSQKITIASSQKKIINDLKLSKATVSKAISRLTDLQYCIRYEHSLMINPYLFYVGKHHERMLDIELFERRLESINQAKRFDFGKDEFDSDDTTVIIDLRLNSTTS
jgi:predicted transcriptional regulator